LILGSTAIALPFAARAQEKAMPVIGYLGIASPGGYAPFVAALRQGLSENGYVEGQNLAIEYRWAEGRYDRLPELAADLVGRKVDVIVATGGDAGALAAKQASVTIPIVFISGGDPVGEGIITSLARPGGNITGVSLLTFELAPKRFELLLELVPKAKSVVLLANPTNSSWAHSKRVIDDVEQAARAKRLTLHILKASTESEIDAAFATLGRLHAGGLVVGSDAFFNSRRQQIVALASRYAVPAIYEWREFATAGGLMSYGTNLTGAYRLTGTYCGKILKGAKPADLPVQQPTEFELVINLKTAATLGLSVPQIILARADEVIE
jgi:putative tryptophan/tyrosine transport system substrate-binding protein